MPEKHPETWQLHLNTSTVKTEAPSGPARNIRVPGLTVIAHPDPSRVGEQAPLGMFGSPPGGGSGRRVEVSRLHPLFAQPCSADVAPRPLADPHLSRRPLWITAGQQSGTLRLAFQDLDAKGRSAVRLDGDAWSGERELASERLDAGVTIELNDRVALLLHRFDPTPVEQAGDLGLRGHSDAIRRLRRSIRQVANVSTPVLVLGPSGSGKELVARALHEASDRRTGPWVSVNMASVPPSLAASELFGSSQGAFTGATRRPGFFRRADGGTLFLDEVGDTPLDVQPLLLRALETGEIQPVGADRGQKVDARVVAATDADLASAVADGDFRAPLFHRLSGAVIEVPALAERRDDIARLALFFLRQELASCGREHRLEPARRGERPWLPASWMAGLVRSSLPGNVRQLRNIVRRWVIEFRDVEEMVGDPAWEPTASVRPSSEPSRSEPIHEPEKSAKPLGLGTRVRRQPSQISEAELIEALRDHGWRLLPTAQFLGISRTSLYALIDKCPSIRRAGELGRVEIEQALDAVDGNVDLAVERLEISKHGLLQRMRDLGIP